MKFIKDIKVISTEVYKSTVELNCDDGEIRYYDFNKNEANLWEIGLKPKKITLIDDETEWPDYVISEWN